ncbi:2-oxoisovalerate dehydrogenase subunit alpha 2 [Scenedesmus sp. PABB004]|nr:2-oxoisovalerate dehydrogenase subunit alpha 2 [Scenedesmus sp. PABB004]
MQLSARLLPLPLLLRTPAAIGRGWSAWRAASASAPASAPEAHDAAAAASAEGRGVAPDWLDVPGGRVPLTHELQFVGGPVGPASERLPAFRALDARGAPVDGAAALPHDLDEAGAVALYTAMARLQVMDAVCYDAQRQGRFSFYMTCAGEEAAIVGSAAGLDPRDVVRRGAAQGGGPAPPAACAQPPTTTAPAPAARPAAQVFSQYREHGVLLWRGFTFDSFANQLFGNALEPGQGRQMPIHYTSPELCWQTVSSPLATQLPHAVGAAYAMKLDGADTVAAAYFGEGAASEGDAHAALQFAAVLGAPVVFVCRNNGFAISTPATEQYAGDGVAARGPAFGVRTVRVDGGDARAMHAATRGARELALRESAPVLVEAMSYRSGHHSTSDDSSRYRTRDEMAAWAARDPVVRFRNWLALSGWWDEGREAALRRGARREIIDALERAAKVPKPAVGQLFTDVYAEPMPWHLREQREQTLALARRHPHLVPPGMPVE